jgi:hypothetical protein
MKLRKRISLVAVSALTAGVMSVVTAQSSSAAITEADSTGLVGELAGSGTTQTAVLLSTGILRINSGVVTKVSSGARLTSASPDGQCSTDGADMVIVPVGAAGSTFTVTVGTAGGTCAAPGATTEVLTVTIAATNQAGVASAANSTVRWASADDDVPTAATDGTNSSTSYTDQDGLFLYMELLDAYDQPIDSTTGALVVTVTTGATIGTPAVSGAAAAGTGTIAVTNANPDEGLWTNINQATVGAGWTGTVTVTYNGIAIATKSGKITGAPASIEATPKKIGTTAGGANEDSFTFLVKDRSGNLLDFTATNYVLDKTSNAAIVSDAAGTEDGTAATATPANGDHTCAGTGGTADVSIKTTINGIVLVSNTFKLSCGGNARTYTASFDKASYIQGELATLTVSFKDLAGISANSYGAVAADGSLATISAPMLVRVGGEVIPFATLPGVSGTITHTFTVGTSLGLTEGAYNAVVNYNATLTNGTVQTVAYKVGTGGTAVTNADVLKSIVSLIASINKQIQALQKLILKRR